MKNNSSILFNDCLQSTINKINREEEKRDSLPFVELSEIETEVLKGLATGRDMYELNSAIKLNARRSSYNAVTTNLVKKFEATSLSNVIYKAMKMGIIE